MESKRKIKLLRFQSLFEPRGYKIAHLLAKEPILKVTGLVYSQLLYSPLYSVYQNDYSRIGPPTLDGRNEIVKKIDLLIDQINYSFWPFNNILGNKIARFSEKGKIELIHSAGWPDIFGLLCKEHSSLPVVHEIYDLYSLTDDAFRIDPGYRYSNNPFLNIIHNRFKEKALSWERDVHKKCDAIIYTSEEMMKHSRNRYGSFKSIVIPNGVLREFLPSERKEKLSRKDGLIHCVYVGMISTSEKHRQIFTQMKQIASSKEIVLHIYPVTRDLDYLITIRERFKSLTNVIIHDPLHYKELYEEITQYDLGLIILKNVNEQLLNTALPNKIFEYVAAGLPVAIPDYESLRNFISHYNCGFIVHDWGKDIVENANEIREIPFCEDFTIDHYMPRLLSLYEQLI